MRTIVITGGTGLIGTALINRLKDEFNLIILTRNPEKYTDSNNIHYLQWNGKDLITETVDGVYGIINLAGENIGKKRWTKKQKEIILQSRINAAKAIKSSIELCNNKPSVWIQASATGYYGSYKGTPFDENSPIGENSFLAHVCEEWEKPINEIQSGSLRKVIIRTGVVLATESDLWKQLTMSFMFSIAAIPSYGNTYAPWIHIDDEIFAIKYLLNNKTASGVFNLTAPQNTAMREIISETKKYRKSFITLHIPTILMNIILGKERVRELIIVNQYALPDNLQNEKYKFTFSQIKETVNNLMNN